MLDIAEQMFVENLVEDAAVKIEENLISTEPTSRVEKEFLRLILKNVCYCTMLWEMRGQYNEEEEKED